MERLATVTALPGALKKPVPDARDQIIAELRLELSKRDRIITELRKDVSHFEMEVQDLTSDLEHLKETPVGQEFEKRKELREAAAELANALEENLPLQCGICGGDGVYSKDDRTCFCEDHAKIGMKAVTFDWNRITTWLESLKRHL